LIFHGIIQKIKIGILRYIVNSELETYKYGRGHIKIVFLTHWMLSCFCILHLSYVARNGMKVKDIFLRPSCLTHANKGRIYTPLEVNVLIACC